MTAIRIQAAASLRLDDIYRYTRDRWGAEQADRYIIGLFAAFDKIASSSVRPRLALGQQNAKTGPQSCEEGMNRMGT